MAPNDRALYELVHRPEEWVRGMAQQEVQQSVAPVIGQVQDAASGIANFLRDQTDTQSNSAKENIKRLYTDVINQDEDYNSNPTIKAEVDRTFQNMLNNSITAARNGSYADIGRMAAFTDLHARATINAIKTMHGGLGNQTLAPQVGTAVVERPTAAAPGPSVEITPDEEQAIAWREKVDPNFRSKYVAAKKTAIQQGDWQF